MKLNAAEAIAGFYHTSRHNSTKKAPEYSEAFSVENIGFVNKGFEALDCALT